MNKAEFEGRLTRDVSLRTTGNGTPVAFYVLAVQSENGSGEAQTDFIPITTYGRQAECDAKYLHKGRAVRVEVRVRSWYDAAKKQGGFHFVASSVTYLGRSAQTGLPTPETDTAAEPAANDWAEIGALNAEFDRLAADVERRLQARGATNTQPTRER